MLTYDSVLKKALDIYYHRDNYAYFYGAKGEVLTDKVMNYLWDTYPTHFKKYSAEDKKRIFDYSRGKVGYDCSGYITAITGDTSGSTSQFNHCTKNPSLADGVCGSLLHKSGHIGIDIGYGFFLHFPREGSSCELGKIRDYNWTESGKHRNVDYTGASNK